MAISNLYSYSTAKANYEDFNVVVGHNVAGKTNLIRILKILVKDSEVRKGEKYIPISFDSIDLSREYRLNPDKPSSVMLELLLSDYEIKILLQFLFQREIKEDNINYNFLRKVNLVIYWMSTPNDYQSPELVLVRFANNFAVWKHKNQDRVGFINSISDSGDDLQRLLASFKNISPQIENNIYNRIGFTYEKWLKRSEFQDPFLRGDSLDLFQSNLEVNNYMHYDSLSLSYSTSQPQQYISEIFRFCGLSREHHMSLWLLIKQLLKNNIVFLKEIRISHNLLADRLKSFRDLPNETWRYDSVKKAFQELFNGVDFRILEKKSDTIANEEYEQQEKYYIQV